jgi:hypothetical protein
MGDNLLPRDQFDPVRMVARRATKLTMKHEQAKQRSTGSQQ